MKSFRTTLTEDEATYREERGAAVIKVREFSNADIHRPGVFPKRFIDIKSCEYEWVMDEDEWFNDNYIPGDTHSVVIYPNGRYSSTEGHVSLNLNILTDYWFASSIVYIEVACCIAVIDAEGCRRFPQTFVFSEDPMQGAVELSIDNYISRNFLLNEDELLPDDTLTMRVEMVLKEYYGDDRDRDINFEELLSSSFKTEVDDNGWMRYRYLLLDSPLSKLLITKSPFFERMSITPMAEKLSGRMTIPDDGKLKFNDKTFLDMVTVLWKQFNDSIMLFTFQEILDVFRLADCYEIKSVLGTCRHWLRLICRTRLGGSYSDPFLGEFALLALAKNKKETENFDLDGSDSCGKDDEWTATPTCRIAEDGSVYFIFQRQWKIRQKEERWGHASQFIGDIANCYI